MVEDFVKSVVLMLVLFNPFLMSVYLIDIFRELEGKTFSYVLLRAFVISGLVFMVFAWAGDRLFTSVLQARFEAFLIFGGIAFLVIAIRYIVLGAPVMVTLRGPPEHLSGTIAMPFMIGPGTVSASVLTGSRLPLLQAIAAITLALAIACGLLIGLKWIHDRVKRRNESLVNRYVEVVGRAAALVIGTIAVEMILSGLDRWLEKYVST
jgi:multiple antibiotic resistance protein